MSSASRTPQTCPHCDSTEIDHDPARGDSVCIGCGAVLEENVIVAEVGFAEDARGRSSAVGQHVNAHGRPNGFSVLPGFSREATAITMGNGRRRIWSLVSALRLPSRHAEAALRLFRLAVERNFHKGRRMANVCCACLYVVVRIERTPHMLIDFSDALETNVYVLGNTFLKFAQILNIELPIIDPSLYIHRFASKLEFGDKTHAVAMSALRLLARMRRDWMSYGRRPNGLCGAALIIAARMHNFYRSQADVVRVVRIGNVALRDRLNEFDQTPTANLTAAEINAGGGDDGKVASLNEDKDAPEAADPPAFRRLQAANAKRAEEEKAANEAVAVSEKETSGGAPGECGAASGTNPCGAGQASMPVVVGGIDVSIGPSSGGRTAQDAELEQQLADALGNKELQELEMETMAGEVADAARRHDSRNVAGGGSPSGGAGGAVPSSSSPGGSTGAGSASGGTSAIGATASPLGPAPPMEEVNMDNDLSDLDDDDAAVYLNTEEEFKVKEAVWMEMNRDYLEKQARLEKLKRENPEEYKRQRPWRGSKKKKDNGDAADAPATTPAEAVSRVMPKASSKKLNYGVLNMLKVNPGVAVSNARPPLP
jgi:transcription factor IIIB 90 kDa subunit